MQRTETILTINKEYIRIILPSLVKIRPEVGGCPLRQSLTTHGGQRTRASYDQKSSSSAFGSMIKFILSLSIPYTFATKIQIYFQKLADNIKIKTKSVAGVAPITKLHTCVIKK